MSNKNYNSNKHYNGNHKRKTITTQSNQNFIDIRIDKKLFLKCIIATIATILKLTYLFACFSLFSLIEAIVETGGASTTTIIIFIICLFYAVIYTWIEQTTATKKTNRKNKK